MFSIAKVNFRRSALQAAKRICHRQLNKATPSVISKLEEVIGKNNVTTNTSIREHHGRDESHYGCFIPDVVTFPQSTEDVSKIARICYDDELPIIPFGTGTGVAGGVVPISGGVVVNLTQMNRVISVNQDDMDASVQPGVTRKFINNYLKDTGLWFPVDPGADASLCGMAATCASGTNAVKYGTMKNNVLNLEVVLSDGTVIRTAGKKTRSRKSAAGYNLTNLFVGSEGTLGLITEATLKLYGVPEMMMSAICQFPSTEGAINSTIQVLQNGVDIARIEYLDEYSVGVCCKHAKITDLEYRPTLFLEFHGSEKSVQEQVNLTEQIMMSNGGSNFRWASSQEERNKLWAARHHYFFAVLSEHPNKKPFTTDVAVPISQLTQVIMKAKNLVEESGFTGPTIGHVGDGNFHVMLLFDPQNEKACNDLADSIARIALEHDGTCTGEHGIGMEKKRLLVEQVGEETVAVMQSIKLALDPKGIMNPNKVV